MIVSVNTEPPSDRAWGATLINVQYINGRWMAVVKDNYYETITVVAAERLRQREGPV